MSAGPYRLDRTLIRVAGPDAATFLDNVLTQNTAPLLEAFQDRLRAKDFAGLPKVGMRYGALLSPQGKLVTDMLLWPQANGVVIETDPARGPDLLRRLTMYKLRAQVEIADSTQSSMVIWSDTAFKNGAPDPRLPQLGWRKLAARDEAAPGDAAYEALRLRLGVPDLARDAAVEEVFALEALLEELNGVDFHKGCFVGQENVSRMKRRATTRKKFCPIVFEGAAPAFGTPVRAGEAELGTVRTGADGRALALLRLDRALAAEAQLTADGRPVRLDPPAWLILPQGEG